jgi:hypothetical protein
VALAAAAGLAPASTSGVRGAGVGGGSGRVRGLAWIQVELKRTRGAGKGDRHDGKSSACCHIIVQYFTAVGRRSLKLQVSRIRGSHDGECEPAVAVAAAGRRRRRRRRRPAVREGQRHRRREETDIVARPGSRLLGFRRTHVERARPSIGPSASLPCSLLSLPLFSLFRPARSTTTRAS